MITPKGKCEVCLSLENKKLKSSDKGTPSEFQKGFYKINPIYVLKPSDDEFSYLNHVSKYIGGYLKPVSSEEIQLLKY